MVDTDLTDFFHWKALESLPAINPKSALSIEKALQFIIRQVRASDFGNELLTTVIEYEGDRFV